MSTRVRLRAEIRVFSLPFFSMSIAQSMQRGGEKDEAFSPAFLLFSLIKRVESLAEVVSASLGHLFDSNRARDDAWRRRKSGTERPRKKKGDAMVFHRLLPFSRPPLVSHISALEFAPSDSVTDPCCDS